MNNLSNLIVGLKNIIVSNNGINNELIPGIVDLLELMRVSSFTDKEALLGWGLIIILESFVMDSTLKVLLEKTKISLYKNIDWKEQPIYKEKLFSSQGEKMFGE